MHDTDIILVPSAFTETTGKAHWETLIGPGAIENLAMCWRPPRAATTLTGGNPWRQHDRRSLGVVLDRLPRGSGVVVSEHQSRLPGEPAQQPARSQPPHGQAPQNPQPMIPIATRIQESDPAAAV